MIQKIKFTSPLRYPGGKTRLAGKLLQVIQKNYSDADQINLVEPYAGGAGASLSLLIYGKVNRIIINDIDPAIHAFWKVAVSDTDYLIKKIIRTDVSIEEWQIQREIYRNSKEERKIAFATLFLNRTNRSGILNGGPIGGKGQIGVWKINARFNKETIIERLNNIKKFKNQIEVSNMDGIDLLKKLSRRKNKMSYFIFLDPPYFKKGLSLYLNYYANSDHEKLSKFLDASPLKKWIMTYDDSLYINKLYSNMLRKKFLIQHNAYKSSIGKEIMIFSPELEPINM